MCVRESGRYRKGEPPLHSVIRDRSCVKTKNLTRLQGLSPESPGQNLGLTVLYAPESLDSGRGWVCLREGERVCVCACV